MYHRILPADDERALREEPGMILTPETLKLHIEIVKKHFCIISLSQWLGDRENGAELPERACALTFDDGWADNFEFAFPILEEMKVPATIFLTSGLIGTGGMFWPERLSLLLIEIASHHSRHWSDDSLAWLKNLETQYTFSNTPPTQEELAEMIDAAKDFTDNDIHTRLDLIEQHLGRQQLNNSPSLLDWNQVRQMLDSGLVEVGSHTCRHTRLVENVPADIIEKEIIDSKEEIERNTGRAVSMFCYPNGDYSVDALEVVRRHYKSAITTTPGWNTIDSDSHLLKRFGMHEGNSHDRTAFLARISGWL